MPKPLYRGSYPRRSKAIREAAQQNPATRCWRCGRTYIEALRLWGPKGAAWQSGHVVDGHPGSPLAAEHARCNKRAGAKKGGEALRRPEVLSPNA